MALDFVLFLVGLLVCSVLVVLIRHMRKISHKHRYTDPKRDVVYPEHPSANSDGHPKHRPFDL